MTRDEFESRYRLLQEVTRAGGATTHNAIGPAGAVVMVHVLDERVEERVRSLADLPEGERPDRILTLLDVDGSPVLVTRFIMDFPDLETWLGSLSLPAPPDSAPIPGDAPGEFTKMFEAADAPDPVEGSTPEGGPEPDEERAREVTAPSEERAGGEFTALFRSPATPEEAASAPSPDPSDRGTTPRDDPEHPEAEDSPSDSGASTRAAPADDEDSFTYSDDPPPAMPSERPGDAPGEFTRMFGAMDAPATAREDAGTEVEREPPTPSAPKSEAPRPTIPTQPPFRPPTPSADPPTTVARPAERMPPPLDPPPPPPPPPVRPPTSGPPTIPGGIPEPRYGVPSEPESSDETTQPDPGGFTARFARPSPERPAPGPAMGPDSWPSAETDAPEFDRGGGDAYLDRLYSDRLRPQAHPSGPPPPSQAPPPPPTAGPPTPRESSGPGAYTQVIAGVRAPMPSAPSAPPLGSAPDRGKPSGEARDSMLPFLIIIGLIVVLAVGLVVGYVLLSNRT